MLKYTLVLCLFLTACASKKLAGQAELLPSSTADNKMDVTAEIVREYSDDYNLLIQVNLESQDGRWVRVDRAELDLTNIDNQPYNVILGKDLVTWADSKAEEKKIRQQSEENKTLGIITAGGALAVLGILSRSEELTAAGSVMAAGGSGYGIYKGLRDGKKNAQGVITAPDSHLYSPFSVPSKSLVKKWILVNAPTGRISRSAILKMTTVEGETLNYRLNLVTP